MFISISRNVNVKGFKTHVSNLSKSVWLVLQQQQWAYMVGLLSAASLYLWEESCLGGRSGRNPPPTKLSHLQLRHEASCRALWQTEQEPPRGCCWRLKKARNVAKIFFQQISHQGSVTEWLSLAAGSSDNFLSLTVTAQHRGWHKLEWLGWVYRSRWASYSQR